LEKINSAARIFLAELEPLAPQSLTSELTQQIARDHLIDLQPSYGYFTPETEDQLSKTAARRWSQSFDGHQSYEELETRWNEIARDFHEHQMWGFKTTKVKVKRPSSRPKNMAYSLAITTFTSFAGTKILILMAGSRASEDPSLANELLLGSIILCSFAYLFYFAYRKNRDFKSE
jgi:hypothetical protein